MIEQESPAGNALLISYNAADDPAQLTTSAGRTFDFDYYPVGSTYPGMLEDITEEGTSFEVDLGYSGTGTGLLSSITDSDGNETQFGYGTGNQVTSITTPAGRELDIGYDAATNNRVTSVTQVDTTDFSTSPTMTFTYTQPSYTTGGTQCEDSASGHEDLYSGDYACGSTVEEDQDGHDTTFVWDNADRVVTTTDAEGQEQDTGWNSDNNVTKLTASGQATTYNWDPSRDILYDITSPPEGSGATSGSNVGFDYYNETGTPPYELKSVTQDTSPSQDPRNGGTATPAYTYHYNTSGDLVEVDDALSTQNTATATYQGDGVSECGGLPGDVCSVTDFDGGTTSYEYNSSGELTSVTPPTQTSGTQLGDSSYTYDALGNVASVTDGNGDTTSYTYNGEGLIKKVTYGDSGNYDCYSYDADGNLTDEDNHAQNTVVSAYSYNPIGLLASTDFTTPEYEDDTDYTYDPVGNVLTVDGPAGDTSYDYNSVNEPTDAIGSWSGEIDFGYIPGNDALLQTISYPGDVTETYGYDNADRATSYQVTNGSGTLINDQYSYTTAGGDDSDLMQSSTDTAGVTTDYTYDPLDRLLSADTGTTATSYSYTYNGDGEMTSADNGGTTTDYTLNENNENEADTYDADGQNESLDDGGSIGYFYGMTWDVTPYGGDDQPIIYLSNGQVGITRNGGYSTSYNALGIDGTNQEDEVRAPGGMLLAQGYHQWGDGSDTDTPSYYLLDPMGDVVGMTDSDGNLADSYTYTPYGAQTINTQENADWFGYRSGYQLFNSSGTGTFNTNLINYGQRFYDPTTATWTQTDPTGQSAAYSYADDDPINMSDPDGELSRRGALALICALGVAAGDSAACFEPVTTGELHEYMVLGSNLGKVSESFADPFSGRGFPTVQISIHDVVEAENPNYLASVAGQLTSQQQEELIAQGEGWALAAEGDGE
jgi:RHS repeat-associated protein